MLIKLLQFFFNKLIGNLPEETKRKFWLDFNNLLREVIMAAAKGAVQTEIEKQNK